MIIIGVLLLCVPISFVVVFGISIFFVPVYYIPPAVFAVILLGLVVLAAFHITGGIFCLRRKYWRVCLASASFAVFFWVFVLSRSLFLLSIDILIGCITWVMLVVQSSQCYLFCARKKSGKKFRIQWMVRCLMVVRTCSYQEKMI